MNNRNDKNKESSPESIQSQSAKNKTANAMANDNQDDAVQALTQIINDKDPGDDEC